jgi:rod shape determining protein RodA
MYCKKPNFFSKIHLDWPLLTGIIAVSILGLITLYSTKQEIDIVARQMLRLLIASAIMIAIAQIPPRLFKTAASWLYFLALSLLLIILITGHISKGAQRWLDLWFVRFQPAELMKIAVPMMLAKYFDDRMLPPRFSALIIPFLLLTAPAILIAKQPDLGTALLILSSGLFVIFLSGVQWKTLLYMGGVTMLCLPTLWFLMHDYQRQRILVLFDPEYDPLGASYQIIQSKIAIGSGGLYGKGWLNGTQSHLEFLPERTTDFIFAVFGEEFGLVGCLMLIVLYLCIILRGLYISVQAQDTFSRLLAGGLVMTLFIYVFVNIGMVTGILPVVGVPLPLVSYGGTSLVTLMASFGILISIQTHRTLFRDKH